MVKGGGEAFRLDASWYGLALEEVEGERAEGVESSWGVVASDTAVIFAEVHIQHPLRLVFDRPTRTHRLGQGEGVPGEAADAVTAFT